MREEIWGSVTRPHIPSTRMVVRCVVHYNGDSIMLLPDWEELVDPGEALAMLLNDPVVSVGSDTLKPCFDVDEMRRRGQLLVKEMKKCS